LASSFVSVFLSFQEVRGSEFYPGIAVITTVTFAANAAVIWLIGRRRNWARIAMLIVVSAMLPLLFVGDWRDDASLLDFLLEWLSSILEVLAMYLLFSGDSPPWFRQSGESAVGAL